MLAIGIIGASYVSLAPSAVLEDKLAIRTFRAIAPDLFCLLLWHIHLRIVQPLFKGVVELAPAWDANPALPSGDLVELVFHFGGEGVIHLYLQRIR